MINYATVDSWTKNHFSVYLYLCAIQANHKITESEIEEFLDQYDILKVDDSEYTKILKESMIEYKQHSEEDKKEFIKKYVPQIFGDTEDAKALMDGLFEISFSDGKVDSSESELIRSIQKIIS